ncbi:MAG: outer membrane protein transport protein [Polyangiaceae bacterium]|nr:outer membrane protein transport protein [Polyangiaceae bacterium]
MRSTAMGNTALAHLETPAAVALNPANLEGTGRFTASLSLPLAIASLRGPVGGEGATRETPALFVPNPSVFVAGRVAPRVVLGGGFYVVSQFGGAYEDVEVLHGDVLDEPRDMTVAFANLEAAASMSIALHEQLRVGFGLRLPFAVQRASQPQVMLGQTVVTEQDFRGFGPPAGRIGLTYHPIRELAVAAVYRTRALTRMHGTVEMSGAGLAFAFDADLDWRLPDTFEVGLTTFLLDEALVLAAEYQLQLWDATHDELAVVVQDPDPFFQALAGGDRVVAPLDWRNTHGVRLGAEYAVTSVVRLRAGFSAMQSASVDRTAQFFTPPPGWLVSEFAGVGFAPGDFLVDVALGHTHASAVVEPNGQQCQPSDAIKVGCPGAYDARAFLVGVSAAYRR